MGSSQETHQIFIYVVCSLHMAHPFPVHSQHHTFSDFFFIQFYVCIVEDDFSGGFNSFHKRTGLQFVDISLAVFRELAPTCNQIGSLCSVPEGHSTRVQGSQGTIYPATVSPFRQHKILRWGKGLAKVQRCGTLPRRLRTVVSKSSCSSGPRSEE